MPTPENLTKSSEPRQTTEVSHPNLSPDTPPITRQGQTANHPTRRTPGAAHGRSVAGNRQSCSPDPTKSHQVLRARANPDPNRPPGTRPTSRQGRMALQPIGRAPQASVGSSRTDPGNGSSLPGSRSPETDPNSIKLRQYSHSVVDCCLIRPPRGSAEGSRGPGGPNPSRQ